MARVTLLSPRRFLRNGYGMALPDGFSLSTLRTRITQAQGLVDRYCNVPKQPSAFDWRGGTMTDEQHQWPLVNPIAPWPGNRRVYLNAGPVKTVTAFTLDLGSTYEVTVQPNQVYVNHIEQYAEIVAISPTIIGVPPIGIPLGLYQPVARVSYTYGWSFAVAGDVLEAESPTQFSAAYGNWSQSPPAVIYLDGVEQGSGYTVDFDDGTVTFDTAPSPGVEVSADYTYLAPGPVVDAIGETTAWLLGQSRINQRGLAGLQSLRVAEVAMTAMQGTATRNGATVPSVVATLLDGFVFGSAAA